MTTISEASPKLRGEFAQFYQREIQPDLERMEGRRRKGVIAVYGFWALAGLGVAFFLVGGLFAESLGLSKGAMMVGGFAAVAVGIVGQMLVQRRMRGDFKAVLVERTCGFLGLDYEAKGFDFPIDRFAGAGLISRNYQKAEFEDHISGEHDGVRFALCEANLEHHPKRSTIGNENENEKEITTVFKGLVLVYSFDKPFSGETRVLPDFTWLGNKLMAFGLDAEHPGERVMLEDPIFEGKFEVYSTDQVEARYLLTPGFMERLKELATHFGDLRNVSFAFSDTDLLVCLRTIDDRFEGGSLFKSFATRDRAEQLVEELGLIFTVIDVLNLKDTSHA